MANKNQSPCITCTRVKDPVNCENKTCKVWQGWFFSWWKAMQDNVGPIPQAKEENNN